MHSNGFKCVEGASKVRRKVRRLFPAHFWECPKLT